jgi:hypothetical protein
MTKHTATLSVERDEWYVSEPLAQYDYRNDRYRSSNRSVAL